MIPLRNLRGDSKQQFGRLPSEDEVTQQEPESTYVAKRQRPRRRARAWERLSPLLAAVFSAALCAAFAALEWASVKFDGDSTLYKLAVHDRTTVSVVINVLASVLGYITTYSVLKAFNLMTRTILPRRQITLNRLRLLVSISQSAYDRNLPHHLQPISALIFTASFIAQWLWTGALTPNLVLGLKFGSIPAVNSGTGSFPFLPEPPGGPLSAGCNQTVQSNGTFTNCPPRAFSGSILNDMSTASSFGDAAQNHSKLDGSGYSYVDRSYGVGASIGLLDLPDVGIVQSYNVSEVGYLTSVNCVYNQASNFSLGGNFTDYSGGVPNDFLAHGTLPGQKGTDGWGYVLMNFGPNPNLIVALSVGGPSCGGAAFQNCTSPLYVSITAGSDYNALNQTECTLSFTPTLFNVHVSTAGRAIQVTPIRNVTKEESLDPRGYVLEWALVGLQSIPMIETTLYISSLGEAFVHNIARSFPSSANLTDVYHNHDPQALLAIAASLEAAFDDILQALSAFALTKPGGFRDAPVAFQVALAKIGSPSYLIPLFTINVVALLVIAVVTLWTRFFADSPVFDFADFGSLLAGVQNGNPGGDEARQREEKRARLQTWDGDPTSLLLNSSAVLMDCGLDGSDAPSVRLG